jgi:FG-GAP-like repeat
MATRRLPLLVSLVGLVLALPGAHAQSAPLFAGPYEAATGPWPYDLGVGDFDGDGLQDLAVPNFMADDVSVLLGLGGGQFGAATMVTTQDGPLALVLADLSGGGTLDLVVLNYDVHTLSVVPGAGDGSFGQAMNGAVPFNSRDVAVGDLDNDGLLDVAVAVYGSPITVMLGQGGGLLGAPATYGSASSAEAIVLSDVSGDGDLDAIVANVDSGSVAVLKGLAGGALGAPTEYAVGLYPGSVAVADLDGDGELDLAVANGGSDTISIVKGKGDGTFEAATDVPEGGFYPSDVAAADLNGDGPVDLAISNVAVGLQSPVMGSLTVLTGLGGGAFGPPTSWPIGFQGVAVAVAELGGDGQPDVATCSLGTDSVSIFVNAGSVLPPWTNLASGLFGLDGIPVLEATGTLQAGSAGSLHLSHAAPGQLAALFVSLASTPQKVKCGTLLAAPPDLLLFLFTNAAGEIPLAWTSWPSGLSGLSLFLQHVVSDGAAPCGAALSNALRADVP